MRIVAENRSFRCDETVLTLDSSTESLSERIERRILHTVTAQQAFRTLTHDFINSASSDVHRYRGIHSIKKTG